MTTPATELRQAASFLRDKASAAIHEGRTTWSTGNTLGSRSPVVLDDQKQPSVLIETYAARLERVNSYLALLGPATGLAVADWLDDTARYAVVYADITVASTGAAPVEEDHDSLTKHALAVARRLLGTTDSTTTCGHCGHPTEWHDEWEGCVGPNGIGGADSGDCTCTRRPDQTAGVQQPVAVAHQHTRVIALDGDNEPARDEAGRTWTHCGICGQKQHALGPADGQQKMRALAELHADLTPITEPTAVPAEVLMCPAKNGKWGRICNRPDGHAGFHAGAVPNGSVTWEGDAP